MRRIHPISMLAFMILIAATISSLHAQEPPKKPSPDQSMPGMDMPMDMSKPPNTFIGLVEQHNSSGTSIEPATSPDPMLMTMKNNWMLMFHGVAFLNSQQQSGPRGTDKLFSTNWMMGMARHDLGSGKLTLRAMLSIEPATVTKRFYPELFQVGETAFNRAIVDGQHPHDFIMELAAIYDLPVAKNTLLTFYAAPVGDPAFGPTAYPHRTSASEDPLATLGHHMQDSTHVAEGVVTAGIIYKKVRLEASGFHGREPDEFRWDINTARLDSWSSRFTVAPSQNWITQFSIAHITSPEQLHPSEDIFRTTASATYNRAFKNGSWSSSFIWGRNHTIAAVLNSDSYLGESLLNFKSRNYIWVRFESVDRTSELLYANTVPPTGFVEAPIGKVEALTTGYSRDIFHSHHIQTALGAQFTFYSTPSALIATYGSHPVGAVFSLRIRPFTPHHP